MSKSNINASGWGGCLGITFIVLFLVPLFLGLWYGFNWAILTAVVTLFGLQTAVTPLNVVFTGILIMAVGGLLSRIGGGSKTS